MNKTLISELFQLSASERIQLAEDLWDSVSANDAEVPLTAEQREELQRRLAEHRRNPAGAVPWDEVRTRLWSRLR